MSNIQDKLYLKKIYEIKCLERYDWQPTALNIWLKKINKMSFIMAPTCFGKTKFICDCIEKSDRDCIVLLPIDKSYLINQHKETIIKNMRVVNIKDYNKNCIEIKLYNKKVTIKNVCQINKFNSNLYRNKDIFIDEANECLHYMGLLHNGKSRLNKTSINNVMDKFKNYQESNINNTMIEDIHYVANSLTLLSATLDCQAIEELISNFEKYNPVKIIVNAPKHLQPIRYIESIQANKIKDDSLKKIIARFDNKQLSQEKKKEYYKLCIKKLYNSLSKILDKLNLENNLKKLQQINCKILWQVTRVDYIELIKKIIELLYPNIKIYACYGHEHLDSYKIINHDITISVNKGGSGLDVKEIGIIILDKPNSDKGTSTRNIHGIVSDNSEQVISRAGRDNRFKKILYLIYPNIQNNIPYDAICFKIYEKNCDKIYTHYLSDSQEIKTNRAFNCILFEKHLKLFEILQKELYPIYNKHLPDEVFANNINFIKAMKDYYISGVFMNICIDISRYKCQYRDKYLDCSIISRIKKEIHEEYINILKRWETNKQTCIDLVIVFFKNITEKYLCPMLINFYNEWKVKNHNNIKVRKEFLGGRSDGAFKGKLNNGLSQDEKEEIKKSQGYKDIFTNRISDLEVAHLVEYRQDNQLYDKKDNTIALKPNLHKKFDLGILYLNPDNKKMEVIKSGYYNSKKITINQDDLEDAQKDATRFNERNCWDIFNLDSKIKYIIIRNTFY